MLSEKFTDRSITDKNKQRVNQERKIKISVGIINQINNHFYQRQKGRVLSMLVASREVYKVNKK